MGANFTPEKLARLLEASATKFGGIQYLFVKPLIIMMNNNICDKVAVPDKEFSNFIKLPTLDRRKTDKHRKLCNEQALPF